MRIFLRFLWMTLLLVIVALISALTAMRFAIHGREVSVPDLQGKTPAEAHRLADQAGLSTQVESNYYSPAVLEGKILSQMPVPGTQVRRGWEIRLAVSLGPQRVTIPQVAGDSELAATMSIAQRGLELSSTAVVQMPDSISGQVIAQDPPADAKDVSAPKISLLVAAENPPQAFVMPSFIGQPLGSVTVTLRDAGFSVGRVTMTAGDQNSASSPQRNASPAATGAEPMPPPSISPASIIVAQDPLSGQRILAGAAINFVVK
jgi:eukaryotic-like serine/threonine-protein kinase